MIPFKTIRARAAKRKGGDAALAELLPKLAGPKALAKLKDDRALAEMAKRVFSAGFVWSVIEKKWPGFEAAFLTFDPKRLLHQPDEFWEELVADKRIVRNPQKITAVRENAQFIADIAHDMAASAGFWRRGLPPIRSACSTCWRSAEPGSADAPGHISSGSSAGMPLSRR